MTYVITQPCCNEGSCTEVCPVDCIRPRPGDADFGRTEMLYIDPATCIDCGACVDACPVDAISADYDLTPETDPYLEINAAYFADASSADTEEAVPDNSTAPVSTQTSVNPETPWRIAIVGSGPSACYAALAAIELLGDGVEISILERLPTPFGLVRYGVAPDHLETKLIAKKFAKLASRKNVHFYLNVEVGATLSHTDLLAHHHAVVYAIGTPFGRPLGIVGEDKTGIHSAADFVSWYNGHPDYRDHEFDLSGQRAVVIGNGNVALDVARILTADIDHLRRGDIPEHALDQLAASSLSEVVVVGRRGPAQAAYTHPELLGLTQTPGAHVNVDSSDLEAANRPDAPGVAPSTELARLKQTLLTTLGNRAAPAAQGQSGSQPDRLITMRYLLSPTEFLGEEKVSGIRFSRNRAAVDERGAVVAEPTGEMMDISCDVTFRAAGFRGTELSGLPADPVTGTLPNRRGRVHDPTTDAPVEATYVAGWRKRGPSGAIGTNRYCSQETIETLVADLQAGRIRPRHTDVAGFEELLNTRSRDWFGFSGWKAIDKAERARGRATGRPRIKIDSTSALAEAAASTSTAR